MSKKLGESRKQLKVLGFIFQILLLGNLEAYAQETIENNEAYQKFGKTLIESSVELDRIAIDYESDRLRMESEILRLQGLVSRKEIDIEKAITDVGAIKNKINLNIKKQKELSLKYKEIDANFEQYVFQTKTQTIVPFIYAIAAIVTQKGDLGEKALYGLAGYGTGALVENSGYGISRGVTWLRYERAF